MTNTEQSTDTELLQEILPVPSNEILTSRFVTANEEARCRSSCSGSCASIA